MNSPMGKSKKGLLSKTWDRCKSFSDIIERKGSLGSTHNDHKRRSKSYSWPRGFITTKTLNNDQEIKENVLKGNMKVVPKGCISIYIGPNKERFVIRTERVNHPLFKTLLEEAESEYGYRSEGPLQLPCEVDYFIKVLMKMDCHDKESTNGKNNKGCNFIARSQSSHYLLSGPRIVALN